MPHIDEVVGEAARHNEDGVDADIVTGAGVTRGKLFGGGGDAAQAVAIERHSGSIGGRALFHFDEGEHLAAPGDEVDLPATKLHAPAKDSPAVEPEPPGGDGLGTAAAPFCFLPAQSELASMSARA